MLINTGSKIGRGVIVNTAATIGHDILSEYVHISPGVHLEELFVSVLRRDWHRAMVINNIEICGKSIIGAGSLVLKIL